MSLRPSFATVADVDELILREEDAQEVSEGWKELVKGVVASSDAWAFRDPSGALAGLGGVVSLPGGALSPWLLCSDVAERYPREVLRWARQAVRALRVEVETNGRFVYNHIPKTSSRNRAFVEHLGFRIVPSPAGEWDLFFLPPCVSP
jgi:hypothetical protein